MKIQIDLKSAVCGLIIGVAAMFVMAAEDSSSNQVGKYRIETGTSRGAGFMVIIDTQTGKAWVDTAANWSGSDAGFWNAK
jgi:hypothetical protein